MSKKPSNAFLLFCSERRKAVAKEEAGLTPRDVTRRLAREWNALDAEGRAPYVERAQESLVRFKADNPEYRYAKTKRRENAKISRIAEPGPDPTGYLAWLGSQVIVQYLAQKRGTAAIREFLANQKDDLFRHIFEPDNSKQ